MVTVALLLETVPVYVVPFNVIVKVCPSSTPTVVTVTVPSLLSSVYFSTSPQLNADVAIAEILGTDVSTVKEELVTCAAAFPAASETSAVKVYV